MKLSRRSLAVATSAGLASLALAVSARADETTTDLAVSCDMTIAPAVAKVGAVYRRQTGIRVRVFPTAPSLLLPQLERDIQNDIIITRTSVLDAAEQKEIVKPGTRTGTWRNRLVIASGRSNANDIFALPDPTPGSEIDGPAVLATIGLQPARVLGVLNTDAVAWSLQNGIAGKGLVFQTDVAAYPGLKTERTVPDAPVLTYAAAITTLAYRGDPPAFLRFLVSPDGEAAMTSAGLEQAT